MLIARGPAQRKTPVSYKLYGMALRPMRQVCTIVILQAYGGMT